MYPVQNYPVYPNQLQYPNPYMQPQVNAVKIDINNPQAYGGVNSHGQINPMAPAPQVNQLIMRLYMEVFLPFLNTAHKLHTHNLGLVQ